MPIKLSSLFIVSGFSTGIVLHLYTWLYLADEVSLTSVEMIVWSLSPYLLLGLIRAFWEKPIHTCCALGLVLVVDISVHVRVFLSPQSSTDVLGLLWTPLVNLVLMIPVGLALGFILTKRKEQRPLS